MRIFRSDIEGVKLLEALGVPTDNCKQARIILEPGQNVEIWAEYYATGDGNDLDVCLQTIIKEFRLVPKQSENK